MIPCPYCASSTFPLLQLNEQHHRRCPRCGLIFDRRRPSKEELLRLYRDEYYDRFGYEQPEARRREIFQKLLDWLEERGAKGRLLDVGAGCGELVAAASGRGWDACGIEPSRRGVELARARNNLRLFNGPLEEYSTDEPFDAITFVNVLEHTAFPRRELEKAARMLRKGGILYLRFPNASLHAGIYRLATPLGMRRRIGPHLAFHHYSFTPHFVKRSLEDGGFRHTILRSSPPSRGDAYGRFSGDFRARAFKTLWHAGARGMEIASGGRILLGASLEATAVKG